MAKRKQKPNITALIVSLLLIIVCVSVYSFSDDKSADVMLSPSDDNTMAVCFIDVGQGDCEFIQFPNGECMLIDSGEKENSEKVIETVRAFGYGKIDYVVATHPHTDHIGGLAEVIDAFDIGEVYMPKVSASTKTFENLLITIQNKNLQIHTAKAGVTVIDDGMLEVKFLSPVKSSYDDLNNYSAVLKVTYGEDSYLFTGDAESQVENELLENAYFELDSDILKVAHHGSRTSSTEEFLFAVSPDYAVVEVGKGNSYNHPHTETIEKLESIGAEILRTDEKGTITVKSSGDGNYEFDYQVNV